MVSNSTFKFSEIEFFPGIAVIFKIGAGIFVSLRWSIRTRNWVSCLSRCLVTPHGLTCCAIGISGCFSKHGSSQSTHTAIFPALLLKHRCNFHILSSQLICLDVVLEVVSTSVKALCKIRAAVWLVHVEDKIGLLIPVTPYNATEVAIRSFSSLFCKSRPKLFHDLHPPRWNSPSYKISLYATYLSVPLFSVKRVSK